jgi:hypothetical protein
MLPSDEGPANAPKFILRIRCLYIGDHLGGWSDQGSMLCTKASSLGRVLECHLGWLTLAAVRTGVLTFR